MIPFPRGVMWSMLEMRAEINKSIFEGYSLIELMIAIAIVGVVSALALPSYQDYIDRGNNAQAMVDIDGLSSQLEIYWIDYRELPISLAQADLEMVDPWGNLYQYFNISTVKGKGKLRKDKSLVPINSDYDLYSMGKDGRSTPPLTAAKSHDDIIRANDGNFIGLAEDF